jgi:hypothetical protein
MEKSDRPQSLATIATDVGLFVHLGNRRPNEIERLKEGAGGSMRQIEAAIDHWHEQLGIDAAASILAVVLLYRHCEPGCIRYDVPAACESRRDLRMTIAAPIVIDLGEIRHSHVEELLRGGGKVLEETQEAMRLVQLRVAQKNGVRLLVPIVAVYAEPRHSARCREGRELCVSAISGEGAKSLAIRYFRGSAARPKRNRT